jgi:hypothetical protein
VSEVAQAAMTCLASRVADPVLRLAVDPGTRIGEPFSRDAGVEGEALFFAAGISSTGHGRRPLSPTYRLGA